MTSPTPGPGGYDIVQALQQAYKRQLRPVVRLEPLWLASFGDGPALRDLADDADVGNPRVLRRNYTTVQAANDSLILRFVSRMMGMLSDGICAQGGPVRDAGGPAAASADGRAALCADWQRAEQRRE